MMLNHEGMSDTPKDSNLNRNLRFNTEKRRALHPDRINLYTSTGWEVKYKTTQEPWWKGHGYYGEH